MAVVSRHGLQCLWTPQMLVVLLVFICMNFNFSHQKISSTSANKQLNRTFDNARVKSGPIFLLDKRTIFISLFEYSHNGIDNIRKSSRWLKARAADDNRLLDLYHHDVIDDLNTPAGDAQLAQLTRDYRRENIYLRTHRDHNVTQFAALVIVNDKNKVVTSVAIGADDVVGVPDTIGDPLIKDEKFIFRYPKCCPLGTYQSADACVPMLEEPVNRVPIHLQNGKRFNTDAMRNVFYEPFHYEPPCSDLYYLEADEESYMLSNGLLLYNDPNFACMDFIENENGSISEVVFICARTDLIQKMVSTLNTFYAALMYISSAALLIWAIALGNVIALPKKINGKTLHITALIYSVFYALHFITLATARSLGVQSDVCKMMGYLYQFLLLSSFTALFALTFEVYYRVQHYNRSSTPKRLYTYSAFCSIPVITTLVSIFTHELTLPAIRSGIDNQCWFRSERKLYYYYAPIIIIICICLSIQILTYINIRAKRTLNDEKFGTLWNVVKNEYKKMFRLVAYLNGITTFCWITEVLAYCFEAHNNFWFVIDALNSMQGIAIFCAFSYHLWDDVWLKLYEEVIRVRRNRGDVEMTSPEKRPLQTGP